MTGLEMCEKSINVWRRIQSEVISLNPNTKGLFLWEIMDIMCCEFNITAEDWQSSGRNYMWQVIRILIDLIKNKDSLISEDIDVDMIKWIYQNYPHSIF
jgi:hypothetical protein